jgi:hypothetical protein
MVAVIFSILGDLQVFIEGQTIKNGFHSTDDYLCNLLDRERKHEQIERMLIVSPLKFRENLSAMTGSCSFTHVLDRSSNPIFPYLACDGGLLPQL